MKWALLSIVLFFSACQANNSYLLLVNDTITNKYGYINTQNDTIIPMGKYVYCYTDTFKHYAIVSKAKMGLVGIDRNERVLYKVFIYDNGPDYVADGYFRILDSNNNMGYADTTGKIVIKPQFGCELPFEKGSAQVSKECKVVNDDPEHWHWESDNWFYIDKLGKRVK
ncbi:WG repeat-containing protein [Inquilinus sp. KBS0705]|nr:WG repeat-containing protein [Inquilinus sp. KBS0705]